jgi:hypothetical protein
MIRRLMLMAILSGLGCPSFVQAQTQVLSTEPPNVEYQYQLHYERPWRGWPGPGLSLGGSLPSRGREGISSFYGVPLPVPLGAGVYVNPFAYSARLPGPNAFGLASSAPAATGNPGRMEPTGARVVAANEGQIPSPGVQPTDPPFPANPRPIAPSSAAALQQSVEIEALGDEKLKHQQWTQAYVNYRNAVAAAADRADAHVRLAIASAALRRFPEASRELKQALAIDPSTASSGATLATLFGPENDVVRNGFLQSVAHWAREDLHDPDRLFVLAAMLRYNDDPRSVELLTAAMNVAGPADHLLAMLSTRNPVSPRYPVPRLIPPAPTPEPPEMATLPDLHPQPVTLQEISSIAVLPSLSTEVSGNVPGE